MRLMSWLRGLKTPERTQRSSRQRRIQGRHFATVSSEPLEVRALLSAISWDGGGGDLNWNTPENWSGDVLPGSSDDVTIDIPGIDTAVFNASGTIHSLTSSEEIVIQGGTLDIAASSSVARLTQFGGTLTGTGDIDVAGDYVWRTGTLSGASTLTVHGGLELQESGAFNNFWFLNGRTLVNLGNGHATGLFGPDFTTAQVFFSDGAEFSNAGSFAIETTVGMRFIHTGGTNSRIVNSGSFTNATSDVSNIEGILFENSGSLSVPNGQFQLTGGFTNAGSCHIEEGTTLLISGLYESESTAVLTGTGHLYLQYATQRGSVSAGGDVTLLDATIEGDFAIAGNLRDLGATFNGSPVTIGGSVSIEGGWNGTGEVTINGLTTWNIGAWIQGTGKIVANGGMHITGTGISRLTGMTIENAGVAIFDGGLIEGYNGSVIHNLPGATFEIRNDADIYDIGGAAQVRLTTTGHSKS
jgi:fibronectin-binding autotransporter adhesin